MHSFTYDGAADALWHVGHALLLEPDHIVSPRGQLTHELRNVTIQLRRPEDCTMLGIGRNWNRRIAVAEFLQLVGGFSDPEAMVAVQPAFSQFLEPSGRFWGAYGERTGRYLARAVERLREDPDTRQAVVAVWDNQLDSNEFDLVKHRDYPCTTYLNFALRDEQLLMTTHMRSNDVWRGWSYDAFQFCQLGWTVANALGVSMGPYTHAVDSLHMYASDMKAFHSLKYPDQWEPRPELYGLAVDQHMTWAETQQAAAALFTSPDEVPQSDTEQWIVSSGIASVVNRAPA